MNTSVRRSGVRLRSAAGWTLVEMLVATAILGTVLIVVTTILLSSGRAESKTVRRARVQMDSRQALSLMETELRQAGADPKNPPMGVVGIVSADSVSIHIRADLNGDGAIQTTEPSEDITYAFNPTTGVLTRNPGSGAATVLNDVTALQLSYFDASGNPLVALPLSAADAALVHSIGLSLTCNDHDSNPITLNTRITLRNM